jgi:ParB family chromosome partitioning protein
MGAQLAAKGVLDHFEASVAEEHVIFRLISDVIPNPNQPRKYFDDDEVKELAASIEKHGILSPLLVKKLDGNKAELVAGERRLRAATLAGLDKVPTILCSGDSLEVSLIENIQRTGLHPIEEAEALKELADKQGFSQRKLSAVLGKSPGYLSKILALNKLPEAVKDLLRGDGKATIHFCLKILSLGTEHDMIDAINASRDKDAPVVPATAAPKARAVRSLKAAACSRITKMSTSLQKIRFDKLSDTNREEVKQELLKLKEIIEKLLGG